MSRTDQESPPCRAGRKSTRHEDPSPSPRIRPAPVDIHRAVRYRTKSTVASSAVDTNLPANAAMLAATAPLAPRTTYNVRVSGDVQATKGGRWVQFRTRAWSFTTA